MKTLQQQYLLIKEGKGNKDHFLKQARNLFPEYITSGNDYNSATQILKGKGILSEAIGGVVTMNPNSKPDWFKIFNENLKEAVGVKIGDTLKHKLTKAEFKITDISGNDITGKYTKLGDLEGKVKVGDTNKTNKNLIGKTYELISEAVGVKNTKEYGDQNEFEKVEKEVQDALDHQFDNKDDKNIDNVYGQSFLMGYYTEMKDPKNADKTVDELKQIVLKNMVKDVTYYNTKASFGVKDIGYTKDVVGGGDPVAPKGKYKSSGYGDMPKTKVIKEGMEDSSKTYAVYKLAFGQPYNFYNEEKNKFIWSEPKEATLYTKEEAELKRRELLQPYIDNYQKTGDNYDEIHVGDLYKKNILREGKDEDKIARYEKYTYTLDGEKVTPDDIAFYNNILGAKLDGKVYEMGIPDENGNVELRLAKGKTGMYTESLNKSKKSNVHTRIKDLEKQNEVLALESKISALEEAINELTQKVSLSESDDLAEMMDPKKINELKKDIKVLEKYKMTCEKKLSKLGGKKTVVDNEEINENENPYYDSDPTDGDSDFDMKQSVLADELYEKGLQAYSEGDLLKAEELYQKALKAGSWLGWTENEFPPYETF